MSKKKQKFYVVWKGIKPGIYDNWEEAKKQVLAVEGAKYKSFESLAEANIEYKKGYTFTTNNTKIPKPAKSNALIDYNSISVDAACSGNPGTMEYRCVFTKSKEEIFHKGPYKESTNNIGEFLALVHALAMLKQQGKEDLTIYSDSKTAISWVRNKKVKTTLERSNRNKDSFELLDRAELWVQNNTFKTKIMKWETEDWGEIPADFGRK
jgi:ribonuclease HI